MKLHTVTFILLVVGGLNWLLVGLFGWDVGQLFGGMEAMVSRAVYILVGLSAVYEIVSHKRLCKECVGMGGNSMPMQNQGGMKNVNENKKTLHLRRVFCFIPFDFC